MNQIMKQNILALQYNNFNSSFIQFYEMFNFNISLLNLNLKLYEKCT